MAATGTPTTNIGLRRPQGTDPASVDDINYNSELIDTKLGAVGDTSLQAQITALNRKIAPMTNAYRINWGTSLSWTFLTSLSLLVINATMMVLVWTASSSDLAILVISSSGTYRKQGVNGVVNFGTTSTDETYTLTRSGTTVTLTTPSNISAKVFT